MLRSLFLYHEAGGAAATAVRKWFIQRALAQREPAGLAKPAVADEGADADAV